MELNKPDSIKDFADYIVLPEEVIHVPQGSWARGHEELVTVGVATCIVIVAHNTLTGEGLLGHFSSIAPESHSNPKLKNEHFDTDSFIEALGVIPTLGPPELTQIWVGGGDVHTEDSETYHEEVLIDRDFALQGIIEVTVSNGIPTDAIKIDWKNTGQDLYISLDCRTHTLLIQNLRDEL